MRRVEECVSDLESRVYADLERFFPKDSQLKCNKTMFLLLYPFMLEVFGN